MLRLDRAPEGEARGLRARRDCARRPGTRRHGRDLPRCARDPAAPHASARLGLASQRRAVSSCPHSASSERKRRTRRSASSHSFARSADRRYLPANRRDVVASEIPSAAATSRWVRSSRRAARTTALLSTAAGAGAATAGAGARDGSSWRKISSMESSHRKPAAASGRTPDAATRLKPGPTSTIFTIGCATSSRYRLSSCSRESAFTVAVTDSQLPSLDARISSEAGSKSGACFCTTSATACAKPSWVRPMILIGNTQGNVSAGLSFFQVQRVEGGVGLVHGALRARRVAICGRSAADAIGLQGRTCSRGSADAAAFRRAAACRRGPATATSIRDRTRAPTRPCRCARRGSAPRPPPAAPRRRSPRAARPSARASWRSARAAPRRRRTRGLRCAMPSMTFDTCVSSPPGKT